ncbi:MAG: hypothetical protein KatS3mg009_1480 [Acidimicrobiia bacterium]|nr:MAG: hypothetical protein KatS3mg009_1480 [Acidimicrobiia bacterium]
MPVDLVIDHSVQVDVYGAADAFARNAELEYERNRERYTFLRWGAGRLRQLPGRARRNRRSCHQVNLEYLATGRVPRRAMDGGAYPDTLVGTDSHTTMVNGLGVLGWGVGGIEAEAAMLGQPLFDAAADRRRRRSSRVGSPRGATATDLVLTVTEMLRRHGVVGSSSSSSAPGLEHADLAGPGDDRQHVRPSTAPRGRSSPSTRDARYLRATGRTRARGALVERTRSAQGLFRTRPPAPYARLVLDRRRCSLARGPGRTGSRGRARRSRAFASGREAAPRRRSRRSAERVQAARSRAAGPAAPRRSRAGRPRPAPAEPRWARPLATAELATGRGDRGDHAAARTRRTRA